MTDALYEAYEIADRRLTKALALQCQPATVQLLRNAVDALLEVNFRIGDARRERQRQRAEALGWTPCEIHGRHTKRPRIDCHYCQKANTPTSAIPLYPSDDLPGQG